VYGQAPTVADHVSTARAEGEQRNRKKLQRRGNFYKREADRLTIDPTTHCGMSSNGS
jgi:hypothetical protein